MSMPASAPPPLDQENRSGGIDWAPIFGYDIFVSYNWTDARPYAARLEADLRMHDLRCFLDNTDAPPGTALNSTLQTALRRSRVLVLLVSKRALQSPWVTEEVRTFAKTGRTIIPVNLDGSVTSTDAANEILRVLTERDCIWIDDLVEGAPAVPAISTVDGIRRSFRYRRANTMRRRVTAAAFAILLVTTIVALYQWRQSRAQLIELQGRQLLIQAQSLQRDQPGRVEPIALLALESQMRSPSAEAVELMRQSLETLAEPPVKTVSLGSERALWAMHPAENAATLLDGTKLSVLTLPSGETKNTFAIEEGAITAISPDGAVVAVWNANKQVVLWDAATGRERWRAAMPQDVASMALSNGGRVLVVATSDHGSLDKTLQVWRCAASSCVLRAWPAREAGLNTLDLEGTVQNYSLSRDGGRLSVLRQAGGGSTYNGESIYVFDAASGELTTSSDYPLALVTTSAFSDTLPASAVRMGQNLYVAIREKRVEVPSGINADQIRFSETGRMMATGGRDGVRIYDVEALYSSATRTRGDIADDVVYVSPVQPVAFIAGAGGETLISLRDGGVVPEGCELLTAGATNVVTQWNCASGQAGLRIPQAGTVKAALMFAHGRQVATQTGRDWQVRPVNPALLQMEHRGRKLELSGDTMTMQEGPQNPVNLSADGRRAAVCVSDALWLWDLLSGRLIARTTAESGDAGYFSTCRMAAGGDYLAVKTAWQHSRVSLGIDAFALGARRARFALVGGETTAVEGWSYSWVPSPTLPKLYLVDPFAAVTAVDLEHPKEAVSWRDAGSSGAAFQGPQTDHPQPGHQLTVSRDGERLALLAGGNVRVWEAKSPGRAPLSNMAEGPEVSRLVLAPNHTLIAVGMRPDRVSVRQTDSGTEVAALKLDAPAEAFEFNPNGAFVGVRTKEQVSLFDARSGRKVRSLRLPAAPASAIPGRPLAGMFHEGQFIGFDGEALMAIDLASGATVWSRPVKGRPPFAVMGQHVAIAEDENSVSIYPQGPGARLARVGRSSPVTAIESLGPNRVLFWGGSKIQVYQLSDNPGPALADRLTRAFTEEEWRNYLGAETWRDTRTAFRSAGGGWLRWLWPSAN
jgi:WD40 repeat protein